VESIESSAGGTSTFSLSPALGDLVLIRCMGDHISGLKRRVMTTYLMRLECRYGFIEKMTRGARITRKKNQGFIELLSFVRTC
jgi:hypothetical protein